jgi:hypothetical protein
MIPHWQTDYRRQAEWLQREFNKMNVRYFEGKLPDVEIRVIAKSKNFAACTKGFGSIIFSAQAMRHFNAAGNRSALLHELAHVKVSFTADEPDSDHGPQWRAEMLRLFDAGAPFRVDEVMLIFNISFEEAIRRREARRFSSPGQRACRRKMSSREIGF